MSRVSERRANETTRSWLGVVMALGVRPSLWATAVRQAWVLTPRRWWRRRPRRPGPPADYLAFRMLTQYGRADAAPEPRDVVNYLAWCKDMRSSVP
ncbi:hypothetical protein BH18ACT3_BH18ACT3_21820 [soil metagenome]